MAPDRDQPRLGTALPFAFLGTTWWRSLVTLVRLLEAGEEAEPAGTTRAGTDVCGALGALAGALAAAGRPDVATAIAHGLVADDVPFVLDDRGVPPVGVVRLLASDVRLLARLASRDLTTEARAAGCPDPHDLRQLAPACGGDAVGSPCAALSRALAGGDAAAALDAYLHLLRERGSGPAALHAALRYTGGALRAVPVPSGASLDELVGLGPQLARLVANTEALVARRPAHNTLLYGPRGSGKSTAVRGLLPRFRDDGLRIVEVAVDDLGDLASLLDDLRGRPQAFVVYVDDLAFEEGDRSYRPLRTLLEGGLSGRPVNVALYATSNRRHLVKERFADRPDPLDDDVHRWDTHNEKLALADRFGLTLTFPDATQRRYLELVRALAERGGVTVPDLDERAIHHAEWGNGYSGRTARQFVDSLRTTL